MPQTSATKPTMQSELLTLFLIAIGLAAIAGIFYWWGSSDRAFGQRKAELLMDQLTDISDHRKNQTGMAVFASFTQEAETTRRLLDCPLDQATWLKIAQQHSIAICTLISMGDIECANGFDGLCKKLNRSSDPRIRELAECSRCALEFEKQYLICKHKLVLDKLLALAAQSENGEAGTKMADRIREQKETTWRIGGILSEIQSIAKDLPAGNSLAAEWESMMGQLISLETQVADNSNSEPFELWVQQTEQLVARYPQNLNVCRSIVQNYDRLAALQCYDEANQMLEVTLKSYEAKQNPDLKPHVDQLIDRRAVAQIELDRWKDLIRSNPSDSAQIIEPLAQGARQLKEQQLVSDGVLNRFLEITRTLEHNQQYDSLSKIRGSLVEVLATDDAIGQRVKNYCAASSKRAALVGQPFVLPSAIAVTQPLDPAILKDRVTAVVFFSANNESSLDILRNLNQIADRHKEAGFKLLAINVDRELATARTLQSEPSITFPVVVAAGLDGTGNNPLAIEYGIEQTPYLILVDQQGNVVDVALSVKDMWLRATALLPSLKSQPSRSRSGRVVGG